MLKILVTNKYYEPGTKILYGYRVRDLISGGEMNITKDALKEAVQQGKVEVVNMTLTSDGRLIGRAMNKVKETVNKSGVNLIEIFTNGRNIPAVMVDKSIYLLRTNQQHEKITGLKPGTALELGHEAIDKINKGLYDNVKSVDGKPNLSNIKRRSFKNIKTSIAKSILHAGYSNYLLSVEKGEHKFEYKISLKQYEDMIKNNLDDTVILVFCLVENAMITNKINILYYNDGELTVRCENGIKYLRDAILDDGILSPHLEVNKTRTKVKDKNEILHGVDIINALNKMKKATPLQIQTGKTDFKHALLLGCSDGIFTFFDNSGLSGMFQLSSNFILNNTDIVSVKLNDNDAIKVAELIRALKEIDKN